MSLDNLIRKWEMLNIPNQISIDLKISQTNSYLVVFEVVRPKLGHKGTTNN